VPIYRAIFWFVLIFSNTVTASNDIHFSSPDSNYINGKIDSIIQNSGRWNLEYNLKSYNDSMNKIIYKGNTIDKIIDTIVIRSEKLILPKILHRAASRIKKPRINDDFNLQIRKKKSMMINKYYFLTKDPKINILRYAKEDCIIMHPGPMNRGIEIDTKLADDTNMSVVKEQVELGVAIRMACLKIFCE